MYFSGRPDFQILETSTSNSSRFLEFPRQAPDEIANPGEGERQKDKSKGKDKERTRKEEERKRKEKKRGRKGIKSFALHCSL